MSEIVIKGILLMLGLAVLILVFGSVVLAADDTTEMMGGPSLAPSKEAMDEPLLEQPNELEALELTKEFERPMSTPDQPSEMDRSDHRPLCGLWPDAITHVYCAPGYDSI